MIIIPNFNINIPMDVHAFEKGNTVIAYLSIEEMEEFIDHFAIEENLFKYMDDYDPFLLNTITRTPDFTYVILDVIDYYSLNRSHDRIGLFIDKNNLIVIDIKDKDNSTLKALQASLVNSDVEGLDFGKILYRFFYTLTQPHNRIYNSLQKTIENLDDTILKEDLPPHFSSDIMDINHRLLLLDDYYDQLLDVIEMIVDNENDILNQENLHFLRNLTNRINRYSSNNDLLRDYLTQVRDSYDSLINFNLNRTMKTFTTITVIFSPLTLVVGWYGMNFVNMPELRHQYGYLYVIGLSIIIVLFILILLRKKKLI